MKTKIKPPIKLSDEQKNQLRSTQLELLDELDRFCKANGLTYYAFGGTLIGAVRHQGFIPWDDDLDVCMPKKDYDILIKKYDGNGKYEFKCPEKDLSCINYFGKLTKKNTKFVEYASQLYNPNEEIFIDVMPILPAPKYGKSIYKTARFWILYSISKKCLKIKQLPNPYTKGNKKSFRHKILDFFIGMILFWVWPSLARRMRRYYINHMHWANSDAVWVGASPRSIYKKEWFDGATYLTFENRIMPAPVKYSEYLRAKFGDYMTPPDKKEQSIDMHPICEFKS